jgi:hypothetical protein
MRLHTVCSSAVMPIYGNCNLLCDPAAVGQRLSSGGYTGGSEVFLSPCYL